MVTLEELGRRLRHARERAGCTQEEAAAALGLDPTAIAKIERGKRGVGALELKGLAALYGTPIGSLLEDTASEVEVQLQVAMRVGEALGGKAETMRRRLQRIIADDRWLRAGEGTNAAAREPVLPTADGPSGYARGYWAADLFREHYGLGGAPIADLSVLADEIGILVSRLPLGVRDAPDGCAAFDPATGAAYVLINSDKPRPRRRFTIAHECGHLILGHLHGGQIVIDESVGGAAPEETEANAFAAGFLMPEQGMRGAMARLRSRLGQEAEPLDWAVWLATSFGVSEEAAAYRLHNLGLARDIGGDIVEAVRAAKEDREPLRRSRVRLGLTPVMADAERGVTEVGPAMRARIAWALETGAIAVEGAAAMLHAPLQEVYRWIAESGVRLGAAEAPL